MTTEIDSEEGSGVHIASNSQLLDLLAEEFGAVAGRIEREIQFRVMAAVSDLERRDAEREAQVKTAIALFEKRDVERELIVTRLVQELKDRLASLKDGKDGERGLQGERGEPGQPGERGLQGLPGEAGPQGVPGERGERGEPGERGERGEQGERGEPGLPGERGERGEQGLIGERGLQGERGEPGIAGERGERGETGLRGEQGISGVRGERGEKGDTGARGERGLEGPRGKLPPVRSWIDRVHYEGDVVIHKGGTYQAKCDTAKPPGHNDWLPLATPGLDGRDGRDGIDAKTFRVRKTYDPKEDYQALDIVTLNSTWFIARKDNPGPCPGEGWQAGPVGKKGERGERGERGLPGNKGDTGLPGREIVDWSIDHQNYMAIPKMVDGSDGPPILIRSLFEQFMVDRGE